MLGAAGGAGRHGQEAWGAGVRGRGRIQRPLPPHHKGDIHSGRGSDCPYALSNEVSTTEKNRIKIGAFKRKETFALKQRKAFEFSCVAANQGWKFGAMTNLYSCLTSLLGENIALKNKSC